VSDESRLAVKVCGITNRDDAERATVLGADYLGTIFVPGTPRFITRAQAKEAFDFAPRPKIIGVFANAAVEEMRSAVDDLGLDGVQLHGDEPPEACAQLSPIRIKVFRVRDAQSLARVDDYATEAVLCDTHQEGKLGGTGQAFDHDLVATLARRRRLFLSGGLNPDNVVAAAQRVRPHAVDVSSGVEAEPGRKDPEKLRNFFARLAEAGLR
jgi:phosphoribosylanthranilate isomerase